MPIVIYTGSTGYNTDTSFLLTDIGKRDLIWKNGSVYQRNQQQYISPGGVVVLKPTSQVEGSINQGSIAELVDLGVLSVEYLPFLEPEPAEIFFETSIQDLSQVKPINLRIKNIGDDPVSGGNLLNLTLTNFTSFSSGGGTILGDKKNFQFVDDRPARVFGQLLGPYNILDSTPPIITSSKSGPYNIQAGVNDVLRIRYSNKNYPLEFINLPTGTSVTTQQVADAINAVLPGLASATAPPNGALQLEGLSNGEPFSIEIAHLMQNSTANHVLGFPLEGITVTGRNAQTNLNLEVCGTNFNISLAPGIGRTAVSIANEINAALSNTVADGSLNRIILTTTTSGPNATLKVQPGTANNVLGFLGTEDVKGHFGNLDFSFEVDGGPLQTISFTPAGPKDLVDIVNEFNASATGATASIENEMLRITSNSVGTNSSIRIVPAPNDSTAFAQLGFDLGQNDSGTNAVSQLVNLSTTTGSVNQVKWLDVKVSLNLPEIQANLTAPAIYQGYILVESNKTAYNQKFRIPVTLSLKE